MLAHRSPFASRRELARLAMEMTAAPDPDTARAGVPADPPFDAVAALGYHPIIGRWLAVTALGPANLEFDPGGEMFIKWPHTGDGGQPGHHDEFTSTGAGVWRPVSATGFDVVIAMGDTNEAGLVTGATVLECRATVAGDGESFRSQGAADRVFRASFALDPALDLVTSLAPLSGIRM